MKQLIDFVPLILFFLIYKLDPRPVDALGFTFELGGPFSATAVLMATSLLFYGGMYVKHRKLERNHAITLVAVLLFGGMTLFFNDELFLKWKAPIVNWIFALLFLISQFVGSKPLVQRMMGEALELPNDVWRRMNLSWVVFFISLGAANLFVAFTFHSIWVDFKVFGSLILTFVFVVGQFALISKYVKTEEG